jgi:hypothetical protein
MPTARSQIFKNQNNNKQVSQASPALCGGTAFFKK